MIYNFLIENKLFISLGMLLLLFGCSKDPTPLEGNYEVVDGSIVFYDENNGDIVVDMVLVEGGSLWMGAQTVNAYTQNYQAGAEIDEAPVHLVLINSFYMAKYEVTQKLWKAVMGTSSSLYNPSYFKGDNLPVEFVTWYDVQEFINKLNSLTGKTFRLPTEAEWEYAARGGIADLSSNNNNYTYSGSNSLDNVAWYSGNSLFSTHEVGTKSPNGLGIFDMTGNVSEWCQDWYGNYTSNSEINPTGATSGYSRVARGGSLGNNSLDCRVTKRFHFVPEYADCDLGFRLVLDK